MRLIDADEVITRTKEEAVAMSEPFKSQFGLLVEWIVGKTSTFYDVDKVVEQLKEVHEKFCNSVACGGKSACEDCEEYIMFRKNIQIVKAGGIDER